MDISATRAYATPTPNGISPRNTKGEAATNADEQGTARQKEAGGSAATAGSTTQLSQNEAAMVRELKQRDTEVRQHEQAHLSAAGGLARSAASYVMQAGPDGKRYAIGGEVQIDVSPGRTPEETLIKARQIQAAALAPAEPSGADRSIAARAQAMETQAQAEIAKRNRTEQQLAERYQVVDGNEPVSSTLAIQA